MYSRFPTNIYVDNYALSSTHSINTSKPVYLILHITNSNTINKQTLAQPIHPLVAGYSSKTRPLPSIE